MKYSCVALFGLDRMQQTSWIFIKSYIKERNHEKVDRFFLLHVVLMNLTFSFVTMFFLPLSVPSSFIAFCKKLNNNIDFPEPIRPYKAFCLSSVDMKVTQLSAS